MAHTIRKAPPQLGSSKSQPFFSCRPARHGNRLINCFYYFFMQRNPSSPPWLCQRIRKGTARDRRCTGKQRLKRSTISHQKITLYRNWCAESTIKRHAPVADLVATDQRLGSLLLETCGSSLQNTALQHSIQAPFIFQLLSRWRSSPTTGTPTQSGRLSSS